MSGADLAKLCVSDQSTRGFFLCVGRVGGIADVMMINGTTFKVSGPDSVFEPTAMCPPRTMAPLDQVRVFVEWIERNAEVASQRDYLGIIMALHDANPCRP